MTQLNFTQFSKSGLCATWIKEQGISIYIRDTRKLKYRTTDFDLANLQAIHLGHGSLTNFLDKYEPKFSFYVENIMNERLVNYLMKRGYSIVTCDNPPSMAIENVK